MSASSSKSKRGRLPAPFDSMSPAELERYSRRFDAEFMADEARELTPAERRRHERARRKGGRPPVGEGAEKIRISIERGLLRRTDAEARRRGTSRSQLIARALEAALGNGQSRTARPK